MKLYSLVPSEQSFWITAHQGEALQQLSDARLGGFGTIHGYRPLTGYVQPPKLDIQFVSRFSTERLYLRKVEALKSITFSDVQETIAQSAELDNMSANALKSLFHARKAALLASLATTLEGDRSDALRASHDRCYVHISKGIKVHLVTAPNPDDEGRKWPVLTKGYATCEAVHISILEINRHVVVPGVPKIVRHGAPVLMGKAIEALLNKRSTSIRSLSLRVGNFDKLVMSGKTLSPDNFS